MQDTDLLSLEEAAARIGYRKRDLRALATEGRLPAARIQGRWRFALSDLARLPPAPGKPAAPDQAPVKARARPAARTSDDLLALLDVLRERDRQLADLQEERAQLTGQLGFLLGRLTEREERIQTLEQALMGTRAGPEAAAYLIASPEQPAELKPPSSPDQGASNPSISENPPAAAEAETGPLQPAVSPISLAAESRADPEPRPPTRRRRWIWPFGVFQRHAPQ